MRVMACLSVLVLLASAAPGRADQATGWRLDQVAGRRALARGELELAGELLATALGAAGQRPGRAAVLEDLFATGVLLADEGKTESAISALRTTLVGRQELYGADSAELEPHLTLLGTLELRTRGRRAREDRMLAVEHLHAARHILERTVGTDHPPARQAASLTVEALRKAGRRSEAAALARALGNRTGEVVPREEPSLDEDSAQLERLASMRRDLARRKSDEAAAIRAAPSGHPGQVLPAPGSEPVQEVRVAVAAPPVSGCSS